MCWGDGSARNSLYSLLNFSVNLKLLYEIISMNSKQKMKQTQPSEPSGLALPELVPRVSPHSQGWVGSSLSFSALFGLSWHIA